MQQIYSNLYFPIKNLLKELKENGQVVQTEKWQGIEKPPCMLELIHTSFSAHMPANGAHLINQCELNMHNLKWADLHFEERIGGVPLNPGETYKIWPWYGDISHSNSRFQKEEKFSHTYMERYWPKSAGNLENGANNHGIRYYYGDLKDVMRLLLKEPLTRQAYLPIWFPEDTGVLHGGRVPCTLGYHFMLREDQLHIHYSIRACDALRHFRNDIYLTVKLLYYVLEYLKAMDYKWEKVIPGIFTFSCMSFHVFEKEKNMI